MTDRQRTTPTEEPPGAQADKPTEIPKRGWFQIAKRGWAEAKADQVPLLAAGVAFYAFMAIFPAMIAVTLLYGLFADPATIADQVDAAGGALPDDVRALIVEQLRNLATTQRTGAGIGAILSLLLALWSASAGVGNLMTAISTAYDEQEQRGFVKKRAIALALTLGAVVLLLVVLGLVAVLPIVLQIFSGGALRVLLEIARFLLVAVVVAIALAVLYRIAPDRDAPKFRWVSVGAVVATVLWLLASIGFSIYVANLSNYAKTYGALASVVILLFWLWITAYAILLGAEINAESEQQTAKDSTRGPERPLGQRGAVKADSVPDDNAESEPKSAFEGGSGRATKESARR
jgi:membrane protein